MSRQQITNSDYTLAYGIDHMCGLYVQVWQKGEEEPIIDMDKLQFPDLNIKKIVAIAEDYGFDLSAEMTEETIR